MTSLIYLIRKSIKNNLKELLHKPGKLILYLLLVAMIGGLAFFSNNVQPLPENLAPMFIFRGILFAFITLFVALTIMKSLSSGDVIFGMNDVNFLFVSPISSRKILLYGMMRMTRNSFYASFFILFQSSSLANFGIDFGGIILILAGFMLAMIVMSILSLIIYNLTNSSPKRKRAVKIIAILVYVPLVIYLAVSFFQTNDPIEALYQAIHSPFSSFIPIAGWVTVGVISLLSGEVVTGLLFLGLTLLVGIGLLIFLLLSKTDYYEDALVSTESDFEKRRAIAEGNINSIQSQTTKKKVKIAGTGIGGTGVTALFHKHVREVFRQNRFGFLSFASVMISGGGILAIYLIKDVTAVLQILMWVQIMLIGTGRGLQETYIHYIYLIPESSFQKIIWSNMELIIRVLMETVITFVVGGLLIGAPIFIVLASIIVYTMFSLMLIGINYLFMRYTGADISVGLLITFYYLAVIIIIAPGLVAAIIAGTMIGGMVGTVVGLLILGAWELVAGLICFALSRGVLDYCDMPVMKKA
ncbi:MAG: putative ABC exporter domain-containing protein [Lachnospiraceae bacterium]|jgi:hypothetical protein|nr:putative ABC exporter domain-containing protein [Lachnospiraceae bacterium]